MINVFYRNRNTIGQFMVALIFLGTFGFLFTFDGFVSESKASGCCGGGEAMVTSFAADSSSDYGSNIPMDAPITGGHCGGGKDHILSSINYNDISNEYPCSCIDLPFADCHEDTCSSDNACGGTSSGCHSDCKESCGDKEIGQRSCSEHCLNDDSTTSNCNSPC